MATVYLCTGSNLDNSLLILLSAYIQIDKQLGKIVSYSPIYETPAWGYESESVFLNQVVKIITTKSPETILETIHNIENDYGRVRNTKVYTDRTLDIDILYYDKLIFETSTLTIPHQHISKRRFVLQPLSTIAGRYIHPIVHKTTREMLLECNDTSEITLKVSKKEFQTMLQQSLAQI